MRSLRAAINAKCKDCIYDPKCGGGSVRQQIGKCTSISCPLWQVRPIPRDANDPEQYPTDPAMVTPEWIKRPVDSPLWRTSSKETQ